MNIKRLLRNAVLDIRYGGKFLGGTIPTLYAHHGARNTANTDYAALPYIFRDEIKEDDILVDVGCGKGRVINWWLSRGYKNRIIGIELDPKVAEFTRNRLKKYKNVIIITGSALEHFPSEATVVYLFNPFDEIKMINFRDLIKRNGKPVRIFYYNCVHVGVFNNDSQWDVRDVYTPFHRLVIMKNSIHENMNS